jgi:hypothetical protein
MDEKDVISEFLGETAEKQSIFQEESEPEIEVEEEREEKPLPFNKDPKVQRYIEKQVEKALKNTAPSAEQSFKREVEEINLPDSFVRLVGNDTQEKVDTLKDLSKYFATLKGEARQEFLNDMKAQEQAKAEADRKAQEELDNYFDEIEETYGVDISSNTTAAKQTRAQFIEYVRKIAPKDENGEVSAFPDLVASFEEFQEKNRRPTDTRAKQLASRGLTRSGDATTTAPTGRSWKDVDRFLDKLKES